MGLTNFTAADFDGSKPVRNMVRSKRDRLSGPQETTKPLPQATEDPEAVPAGTVPEVLTWVGDDPVRAQKALDEENKNDRPRKGLVSSLTEKVNSAADGAQDDAKVDEAVEKIQEDVNANDIPADEDDGQSAVDQPVKANDGTDATEPTDTNN
jgi:hypothetical protein